MLWNDRNSNTDQNTDNNKLIIIKGHSLQKACLQPTTSDSNGIANIIKQHIPVSENTYFMMGLGTHFGW